MGPDSNLPRLVRSTFAPIQEEIFEFRLNTRVDSSPVKGCFRSRQETSQGLTKQLEEDRCFFE